MWAPESDVVTEDWYIPGWATRYEDDGADAPDDEVDSSKDADGAESDSIVPDDDEVS